MRKVGVMVAVWLLGAAIMLAQGQPATKYGEGVSLEERTPIARLVSEPEAYVGKRVRVEGVVTAVCENMGCWMQLQDERGEHAVRIKVDDGVIVFPVTAKGRRASAEGVFERVDSDAEAEHHAAAPADHQHAPPAAYQIKATGAVIY